MTCKDEKEFSLLICSTLDSFGFKKESVSQRAKCEDEKFKAVELWLSKIKSPLHSIQIPVGSSGEGVALSTSDGDMMFVFDDVICVDKAAVNEQFTILETDYTNTAPGYTKVMFVHKAASNAFDVFTCPAHDHEYVSIKGHPYASSAGLRNALYDIMNNGIMRDKTLFGDLVIREVTTNGPALTQELATVRHSSESDIVRAVYYYGNRHLSEWASRPRLHNWPAGELVRDVSEMEGYIVPIGDKQSENQNLEWRVCYTTAEKKLISTLNSVQIKLYVLLKMVAKEILKPVCKAITSYVVKNVVFWVVERTPPQQFSPELMVNLLRASLHFMKHCLENNHFPNYMIPERNLLRGGVCGQEKQVIIRYLSECLDEGGFIVLRIPKLRQCLTQMLVSPGLVTVYEKWRDELEEAHLIYSLQFAESLDANPVVSLSHVLNLSDIICKMYADERVTYQRIKFLKLVIPELPWLILTGRANEITEIIERRIFGLMLL